jgi:hypothetical protein
MKLFEPDMRKFSGFYILMFALMVALVAWGIAGAIAWG